MATGSFIEMFMTTFGWHLYDIVWGIIASTGLAYLPILAVIIDNVIDPIESQDAKSASVTSLRRLEIDVIRIIVLMVLAVTPMMTLQYGSVSHTKACQGQTFSAGSSGTVFDEVFSETVINNNQAKVPPWFYLVMSVSGGINDAFVVSLPCDLNVRQIQYEMSTVRITDPHLRRDTQRFVTECYEPARADFFNNGRQFPENLSNDDIDWIGSQYFNNNYYRNHYSKNPVSQFPFDTSRESDASHYADGQLLPESGYPSCSEWWNDSTSGLRGRLSNEVPQTTMDGIKNFLTGTSTDEAETEAIRQLMRNEGSSVMEGLELGSNAVKDLLAEDSFSEAFGGVVDVATEVGATTGGVITQMLLKPVLYMVKEMAPYVQATMLMGTYFLLPWILLVGKYEWATIMTATITIFAIKFWTSIWAVVDLLDNKLATAIREASGHTGLGALTGQSIMLGVIVDLIILSLYMALPFYFLSILGWGGERGASAATSASGNIGSGANRAGDKAGNLAEGAVTKG